jgi:hypothetical protein
MSSPQLSGGFELNQAKPQVNRHFLSSMGQKLSSLWTSCGSLHDWRCMKNVKQIRQDIWSLIQQNKSDAMPSYSQLVTYKPSDATMTATHRRGPSASVIWSFVASKTRQGFTRSTRDGKGLSSSPKLHDRGHTDCKTLTAKRYQTPRTSITYAVSIPR